MSPARFGSPRLIIQPCDQNFSASTYNFHNEYMLPFVWGHSRMQNTSYQSIPLLGPLSSRKGSKGFRLCAVLSNQTLARSAATSAELGICTATDEVPPCSLLFFSPPVKTTLTFESPRRILTLIPFLSPPLVQNSTCSTHQPATPQPPCLQL